MTCFLEDLGSGESWLSPDLGVYKYAKKLGRKIYAMDPLPVYHQGGFSNTWNKVRSKIPGGPVKHSPATGQILGVT
jgi:hypothetical protein